MQRSVALVLFAVVAVGWAAALLVALVPAPAHVATFIYAVGSLVCHQIAERSFHLAGAQLPVCARCTGLYVGAAMGVILWWVMRSTHIESPRWAGLAEARDQSPRERRRVRRGLIVAVAPTMITVATATVGLWDPGNAVRAALAAPLGMTVSGVVMAVLSGHLR